LALDSISYLSGKNSFFVGDIDCRTFEAHAPFVRSSFNPQEVSSQQGTYGSELSDEENTT
jgi:hypothetical protein